MFEVWGVGERANGLQAEFLPQERRGVSPLEFFAISERASEAAEAAAATMGEEELAAGERARQTRAMLEAVREEAATDARRSLEVEMEAQLGDERARVEEVCAQFARDRERYFAAAEAQVVRLALATARRVLAREVAGDPMHLTATVRAALGRVQDGSATVLRVPAEELEAWAGMFAGGTVEVIGDEGLGTGECALETNLGRVELGVEVQMGEIERGFGELLRRQGE